MPLYYSIFRLCSKNRTSCNFHHFIDIPYHISQKIDYNCFLSDISDMFPYWSETPILPNCSQLFTTILVEYIQLVIALKLIELIQGN